MKVTCLYRLIMNLTLRDLLIYNELRQLERESRGDYACHDGNDNGTNGGRGVRLAVVPQPNKA
jgi:hypothetical protein